jgi:predicted nucleic acid-binding protein
VMTRQPGGLRVRRRQERHLGRERNRGHTWWPDAVSPAVVSEVRRSETARQVTDRYLSGLARRYGGQLVTFDGPIAHVGGSDVICLLPSA